MYYDSERDSNVKEMDDILRNCGINLKSELILSFPSVEMDSDKVLDEGAPRWPFTKGLPLQIQKYKY